MRAREEGRVLGKVFFLFGRGLWIGEVGEGLVSVLFFLVGELTY